MRPRATGEKIFNNFMTGNGTGGDDRRKKFKSFRWPSVNGTGGHRRKKNLIILGPLNHFFVGTFGNFGWEKKFEIPKSSKSKFLKK
jgi:hypothetical protein